MRSYRFTDFNEASATLEFDLNNAPRIANTRELTNVVYTVIRPNLDHLKPHQPWADQEFKDRLSGYAGGEALNPGRAWRFLTDIWVPMMEDSGKFSYTYSERMADQLLSAEKELKRNTNSRESFIGLWDIRNDWSRLSKRRVPCTIGYQFLIRNGLLEITYLQRSCNFFKHYQNDAYLAVKLQQWMAEQVGVEAGPFHHWLGSFHIFI